MKALILSYVPGMFGEFIATQIKNSSDKFAAEMTVEVTVDNRYMYPNYLLPLGVNYKNIPMVAEWPITEDGRETLEGMYGDKHICIPTHWLAEDVGKCNLPSYGIRLFSENEKITNLGYCMFWIKSHRYTDPVWALRRVEILQMIEEGHKYADQLTALLDAEVYENWKFLSYKLGYLKNGELDIETYVKKRYVSHLFWNARAFGNLKNWEMIDVGTLVHGDHSNLSQLETAIGSPLNLDKIKSYAQKNEELLLGAIGLTINDLTGTAWLARLCDYVKSNTVKSF